MSEHDWNDAIRLMKDLRADGYSVEDLQTSTSLSTADDKMVQLVVSRD